MAHILLLEPNAVLANQYARYLEVHGHTVARTQRAQDAILKADTQRPDLIILELMLASHNGIEFLHEFRSYAEWKDIPVLILSHLHKDEFSASEIALRQLGIIGYLYKPETNLRRLLAQVEAQSIATIQVS